MCAGDHCLVGVCWGSSKCVQGGPVGMYHGNTGQLVEQSKEISTNDVCSFVTST